jgi:nucleoside-diphosphate-sugar epimerase
VDEQLRPEPESIYHRTKLAAEALLKQAATEKLKIRILRMSRCFPEAADRMAAYRLHRGIDARDVAKAHKLAVCDDGPVFACHLISGATPFEPEDCQELAIDAGAVIERRAPHLAQVFRERGWDLPASIDRVYSSRAFCVQFDWNAQHGYEEVLAQHDRESLEVLPVEESLTKLAST